MCKDDSTTREERLQDVGRNALASIREMVTALECDYDRLQELRDERDGYTVDDDEDGELGPDMWGAANPDEAEELRGLEDEAACGDVDHPCDDQDDARQRIEEDALSVRVFGERTDGEWSADRFELLLATGGPAVRIMGELSDGEPTRAWLEVQDWGTPWTEYYETGVGDVCLAYSRCFYFGE